jgi:hypothetical protein
MLSFNPIRYIRAHPFSIVALSAITGDCCYLGYAFDAEGFVSLPKFAGASFTIFAHILLLAYGDDQMRKIAHEPGILSRIILALRARAQRLVHLLPPALQDAVRAKPVGIPFAMLAMNGVGLLADALIEFHAKGELAMGLQVLLGISIVGGTGAFALADFLDGQLTANRLVKTGSLLLSCTTFINAGLALKTLNPFLLFSITAFGLCNWAMYYTRVEKG